MQDLTLVIPAKYESESLPTFLSEIKHLSFKKQTVYSTIIMCKPAYVVHIHLTRVSPNKCSTLTSFEMPEVIANKILKNLVYNSF